MLRQHRLRSALAGAEVVGRVGLAGKPTGPCGMSPLLFWAQKPKRGPLGSCFTWNWCRPSLGWCRWPWNKGGGYMSSHAGRGFSFFRKWPQVVREPVLPCVRPLPSRPPAGRVASTSTDPFSTSIGTAHALTPKSVRPSQCLLHFLVHDQVPCTHRGPGA